MLKNDSNIGRCLEDTTYFMVFLPNPLVPFVVFTLVIRRSFAESNFKNWFNHGKTICNAFQKRNVYFPIKNEM